MKLPGTSATRVAQKKNPRDPAKTLSMGFGFVEFSAKGDAMKALKELQHAELDGHKVELKYSTRSGAAAAGGGGPAGRDGKKVVAKGSKLLLRNLAFECDRREVRELCAAFGQIKSVRMPKKFDGSHRGFAFVDFLTKKEARAAFEALSASTHLYGRRLVVEWAEDDDSVEALQAKTRETFVGRGRKKQFRLEDEDGALL